MIHLSSTLLLVGFLGGESSFELFDDVGVHVLVDLDGQEEDDEAGDDTGERQVVGAGLERADVRGGHVGGGGVADHSGGDDHEAHDAVGQRSGDLVEHRAHGEGDGLVALAGLELAVFDGVGHAQDGGHLDGLRRQVEEDERDDDDGQVHGRDDEQRVAGDHERHAGGVQPAARDAAVEHRVEGRGAQSGDDRDDAGDGEAVRSSEHVLELIKEHAGGGDVGHGVQQVAEGYPQELVVLGDGLERLDGVAVGLGLGAQPALVLSGAERDAPRGQEAEHGDDDGERRPAGAALLPLAGELPGEPADDGHDDDGDAVVADGSGERAERGVRAALVRVGGDRGDHAPVGDVAQRVDHVEQDEHDDEQDHEHAGVHVHEAEQAGEHHDQQDAGHDAADELPRAEPAPAGVRVVHEVAEQRVEEDLRDADDHHESGDHRDEAFGKRLVHVDEQRGGHERDEERAHRVVERGLAQVTECVCDLLTRVPRGLRPFGRFRVLCGGSAHGVVASLRPVKNPCA